MSASQKIVNMPKLHAQVMHAGSYVAGAMHRNSIIIMNFDAGTR